NAGPLEQHAGAASNHVAELAHTATRQRVELAEPLTHHLTHDRQRGRLGHAIQHRPRQCPGHAHDGCYFAGLEIPALDSQLAATDAAAQLLLEHASSGQHERLGNISAHIRLSTYDPPH